MVTPTAATKDRMLPILVADETALIPSKELSVREALTTPSLLPPDVRDA